MINLSVRKLGIVKDINLDIKPLTIFIGENNTNKSWVAYSLYGILHKENRRELTKEYLNLKDTIFIYKNELKEFINDIVDKLTRFYSVEIKDCGEFIDKYLNQLLNDLAKNFSRDFIYSFFGINRETKLFSKTEIDVYITEEFKEKIKEDFINSSLDAKVKAKDYEFIKVYKGKNEKNIIIEISLLEDIPVKYIKRVISDIILDILVNSIFKGIYLFPSERKALATFSERLQKSLISKVSDKNNIPYELLFQFYLKEEFEFPILLEDFIKFVSDLKKNRLSKYTQIKKFIETIIGGKVVFDEMSEYITFVPYKTNNELPVYSTSSMVKSLSTFYLYLEKIASGKDFIILDEPEMNLHPKAQAEFLELLSIFINGIEKDDRNFLIATTHTPYILEHLENLILGYCKRKELANLTFLKTENAFISPENISIYQFLNNGTVKNLLDRENKYIDWSSFSKVSSKLSEIGFNIEEKISS